MPDLHNDEPTLNDRLGREALLKRVGDDVAECKPPSVFGIHGEWGSGKTSFLHQLHWYLTGDCPEQSDGERQSARERDAVPKGKYEKFVTAVWFEAWRYQHENEPIIALLQEIRTQLPFYSKWLNEGRKLSEVAVRGALLSLEDLTKRIGFKASKVQEVGEQWERENLATALPSHTIREHLDAALSQLLGKQRPKAKQSARLVVLIDDLDRCEPTAAFRLLEGIKIYLNLPSCVFVLGMNQRIIERAISKHTAKDEPAEVRQEYAREYLDKLCTNIWHLPAISDPAVPLAEWLPESPVAQTIRSVIREHHCVAANPRRIKSFANVLQRFLVQLNYTEPLPDSSRDYRHAELTVFMACLYHEHYELYRMIESQPAYYSTIHQWAGGQPVEHELLTHLRLPLDFRATDASEQQPTPSPEPYATFPDPERGNVFRLQSLVQKLGPLAVTELTRYLLMRPTSE